MGDKRHGAFCWERHTTMGWTCVYYPDLKLAPKMPNEDRRVHYLSAEDVNDGEVNFGALAKKYPKPEPRT